MGKTDRTEIINILDWLEEDAKQELRKEERADYLKLKTRMVKLKTDAILEMYHSIQESKDDRDKCLEALGKVHLCYRLGFITKAVYSEHRDYLRRKVQEQTDWKALYDDLQQHYERQLEESEYWNKEYESISCAFDDMGEDTKE
jgi:hypothetical protein